MITTPELIEHVKEAIGKDSNYAVAKALNITKQAMTYISKGESVLSESTALRAADLTNLDPGYVLYSIAAERAQHAKNERLFNYWKEQADKITPIFLSSSACFLIAFSAFPLPI